MAEDVESANRIYSQLMLAAPQGTMQNLRVMARTTGDVVTDQLEVGSPLAWFGMFTQNKLLPLRFMSMLVEIELVDSIAYVLQPTSALPSGTTGQ